MKSYIFSFFRILWIQNEFKSKVFSWMNWFFSISWEQKKSKLMFLWQMSDKIFRKLYNQLIFYPNIFANVYLDLICNILCVWQFFHLVKSSEILDANILWHFHINFWAIIRFHSKGQGQNWHQNANSSEFLKNHFTIFILWNVFMYICMYVVYVKSLHI